MFDPKGFENSRPDGFSVLEVVPEEPDREVPRRFVPLKHTQLTGEVAGPLADLRLIQTFGYTPAECDKVLEAVYRFPLPGDAAVTGVTVRFGDVTIVAELKERVRAEAEYDEAKRQGRQATLATRESPDVFTLHVAGIKPNQNVTVETGYVQLARYEGSDWTLRIPLTTAPRYVREDEGNSRHAQGQPLALMRDPGHRFSLDLNFRNAELIQSPTHALRMTPEEEGLRTRLQEEAVVPDRDCVLTWRAEQKDQHPALHLLLHEDTAAKQVYFLALVAPPKARPAEGVVPRDAILLVDHSGSMEGAKWEAADWTVTRFLQGLTPQDSFSLGLFHDTTQWFARKPVSATPDAVAAGVKYLRESRDSGGTNLGVALEQALSLPRTAGSRARHVLLVTDAEVSDGGRILRMARDEAKEAQRRRINVICIDAAPNSLLATELAERGGGVSRFLTSDPQQEDITTALETLLEDWSAPVLTGVRLAVNRSKVEAVERASGTQEGGSWIDIGDLPAGRAVWVAGRVPRGENPDLSFRLVTESGAEIAARRLDLGTGAGPKPALKALFGARRVLGLEFLTTAHYSGDDLREQLARLGYDPNSALIDPNAKPKLYGENVQQDADAALKGLLAREALEYGLASAETAFIAVRSEAGQKVEETVAVPNALPSGWSEGMMVGGATFGSAMPSPAPSAMPTALYSIVSAQAPPPPSPPRSAPSGNPGFMQQAMDAIGGFLGGGGAKAKRAPQQQADYMMEREEADYDDAMALMEAAPEPLADWQDEDRKAAAQGTNRLFFGAPVFANGEAVLFDSTTAAVPFAGTGQLSRLEVTFPQGALANLDSGLVLLLYVGDLAAPRIRVRLSDLMQQGGTRPLNILRGNGQVVRLVLKDASGAWAAQAPQFTVTVI